MRPPVPHPAQRILRGAALPARVRDLDPPPERLHVRGELPRGAAVAVVGTRRPSSAASAYAFELAQALALEGVCVLSGGADGIDTQAHLGALDAGGSTVVVAPCGFERPFPTDNAELFRRVVSAGGAYVSLHEDDVPAGRAAFFARNRLLVALADVVVVVEAPVVSGARNTAKHARQLGRPLFVCAAPPWSPAGLGCTVELGLGARALQSPRDVFRALAARRAHAVRPLGRLPLFTAAEQPPAVRQNALISNSYESESDAARIVEAVRSGATHVDAVCAATGLPASRVQQLVLTLTLDGVLVPDSAGRLSAATP